MPKKSKKGKGGHKKTEAPKRELVLRDREENERYAQIIKSVGDGRMMVFCFPLTDDAEKNDKMTVGQVKEHGSRRLGIIRGKMRKRVWMGIGDFVLVGIRDFQDDKCDIIHKYDINEARKLRSFGELPDAGARALLRALFFATERCDGLTAAFFCSERRRVDGGIRRGRRGRQRGRF